MVVTVARGRSPLILAFPHSGTEMPAAIHDRLNENGRLLADTDWHLGRLYDGLAPEATTVRAHFHRYVIDANRDPSGQSLYPGKNTTGLVPLTDFDGQPIWRDGAAPDAAEIAERTGAFHAPYHAALRAEIDRMKDEHGIAVLFDCHSIRAQIPFLFDGTLPELNIGTNRGATCAPELEAAAVGIAEASGRRWVLNGRFLGGWTTRHYGRPDDGVHAIQMELAQSTHLATETPPFDYDSRRADRLRPVLAAILTALTDAAQRLVTAL